MAAPTCSEHGDLPIQRGAGEKEQELFQANRVRIYFNTLLQSDVSFLLNFLKLRTRSDIPTRSYPREKSTGRKIIQVPKVAFART